MKKTIWVVCFLCVAGCTRTFWLPEMDKAISERKQVELNERQVAALEKIAECACKGR